MKKLFFLVLLIAASLIVGGSDSSAQSKPTGRIVWQFNTDQEYWGRPVGPVQRAVVDPEGRVTYFATMGALYKISNREILPPLETRPEKEARLALAPGGNIYGWLLPHPTVRGLFYARLKDISGTQMVELRPKDFPYGFSAFYMGYQGKMIVTEHPLDDRDGLRGRFQFTLWDEKGHVLKKKIVDGRQIGVLDAEGKAILLLGEKEARLLSSSGEEIPPISGKYRKAAIAKEGKFVLLNPSSTKEINQVLICKREVVTVDVPTPVHNLALVPDDSSAVVVGDKGRYFFLDLSTGQLKEGPPLPFEGTFQITSLKFVDANTLAMGILHREGEPPKTTWPKGTVLIIDLGGKELFRKELSIKKATAFDPKVEVKFGSRFVIVYTEETLIQIELER